MTLTREELKAAHNNIMTVMEDHIMMLAHCDRRTANLVANEILDLDRDADRLLSEEDKYEENIDYDVCEYKEQKNKFGQHIFITSCGKDLIQYGFMFEYNYCPYCGKKIKIVGD